MGIKKKSDTELLNEDVTKAKDVIMAIIFGIILSLQYTIKQVNINTTNVHEIIDISSVYVQIVFEIEIVIQVRLIA